MLSGNENNITSVYDSVTYELKARRQAEEDPHVKQHTRHKQRHEATDVIATAVDERLASCRQ